MTSTERAELIKDMAVGISRSLGTARPITGLDEDGAVFVDLPQLSRIIVDAGWRLGVD